MKKKFLIVLLSIVCALCLALGLTACNKGTTGGGTFGGTEQSGTEQSGTEQGDDEQGGIIITVTLNYTLSDDGNSYTVSGIGSCTDTDIEIPSTYEGKPVTAIGGSAFYQCTDIVTITIPESVTTIGDSAFYGCSSLKSVTIPNGVTTIGASAFGDCTALVTITIGEGVISIGSGAFSGCYKLLEIYNLSTLSITSGSNDNGGAAYYAKEVYTSADTESKITETNYFIFYNDNGAYYLVGYIGKDTDITLPDSVNGSSYEIYNSAFYYNTKLTSVNISNGVTSINRNAFGCCTSLTDVTIGSSVTSIEDSAFYDCISLTNVAIGNNVTSIGSSAFSCCYSLTNVIIPDSVTTIGYSAFEKCYSLVSVTIGSGVTAINGHDETDSAFCYCNKLIEVYNRSSLEITAGSWGYGMEAYYARNVYTATSGASKLIYKDDYIFYNDDGNYYLMGYTGNETEITLPDSINGNSYAIYDYAFYSDYNVNMVINYSKLTSVTISDGVTSIGRDAFLGQIKLTSVTIGDNVTSIDLVAFSYCTSLTDVTIGSGVTSIEIGAFYNCTSLTNVYYNGTASQWASISFGASLNDMVSTGQITETILKYFGTANPLYYADNLYIDGTLVTDLN